MTHQPIMISAPPPFLPPHPTCHNRQQRCLVGPSGGLLAVAISACGETHGIIWVRMTKKGRLCSLYKLFAPFDMIQERISCPMSNNPVPVFRIRDILVRIRILGSVPWLTDPDVDRIWPRILLFSSVTFKLPTKNIYMLFEGIFTSFFKSKKS